MADLGAAYRAEVPEYAALSDELIAGEVLRVSRRVVEVFLEDVAVGRPPDAGSVPELEEMGRRRLEMGIPLEAMLHVYRIAGRGVFSAIVAEIEPGEEAALGDIGAQWLDYIDRCSTRASSGYIAASNERVRRIEARRGAVLQALLGAGDSAEVAAVASEFSLSLAGAYTPLLISAEPSRLDELSAIAPPGSLSGFRSSALLLLVGDPATDLRPITHRFADVLVVCGLPQPAGPALRAEVERAERVLTAAAARGMEGVLGPHDLLVEQFVLADRRTAATLDRAVLARLRAKDPSGTLVATLRAFLETGSVPATAERMVVHPNTAAYRLRRVAEISSYDPRVPAQAAVLVLALAAEDVGAL